MARVGRARSGLGPALPQAASSKYSQHGDHCGRRVGRPVGDLGRLGNRESWRPDLLSRGRDTHSVEARSTRPRRASEPQFSRSHTGRGGRQ